MTDQGKEAIFIDARMNPTGYEETELTYNIPEEFSASGHEGGGFEEEGIETECGLGGEPLPGPSKRNTGTV